MYFLISEKSIYVLMMKHFKMLDNVTDFSGNGIVPYFDFFFFLRPEEDYYLQ